MSEAADQEVIEVAPVEEDTSGIVFSEESPAEEIVDPTEKAEVKEPVRFSEDQQKVFDEAINKKTAKTREAERLAQKLQEDLEQLRKQVPQETRPDIPALPDPYDDDFAEQMAARDNTIIQAARFDSEQRAREQARQDAANAEWAKQQEHTQAAIVDYSERSKKLGIEPVDLQQAGAVVGNYGLTMEVATHILREAHGPSITVYLSKNPTVLDEISRLSPMDAAVRISTDIKEAARNMTQPKDLAPDPVSPVRGSGMPEGDGGPKGATFV